MIFKEQQGLLNWTAVKDLVPRFTRLFFLEMVIVKVEIQRERDIVKTLGNRKARARSPQL